MIIMDIRIFQPIVFGFFDCDFVPVFLAAQIINVCKRFAIVECSQFNLLEISAYRYVNELVTVSESVYAYRFHTISERNVFKIIAKEESLITDKLYGNRNVHSYDFFTIKSSLAYFFYRLFIIIHRDYYIVIGASADSCYYVIQAVFRKRIFKSL